MKKIIYDFGANNGDDIPYFLEKADVVVAVEANPELCRVIEGRFSEAIDARRLHVENVALSVDGVEETSFYIHNENHVLSQLPRPDDDVIDQYRCTRVSAVVPADIIRKYGDPHYVKIDVEHYDHVVLRNLFENGIFPPYISAEAHDVEVFALLVAEGAYNAFKLVDGRSVCDRYRNWPIETKDGRRVPFSFPFHSVGPFGADVAGDWLTANAFLPVLAREGLGWKDIHATNTVVATASPASDRGVKGRSAPPAAVRRVAEFFLTLGRWSGNDRLTDVGDRLWRS